MCHLNHLIDTSNLFPTSFSSYYFFPPRFLCLLYNFSKQSFNLFSLQIASMLFWLLFFSLWIIYKIIIIFQFHCPLIFLHLSYLDFGFFLSLSLFLFILFFNHVPRYFISFDLYTRFGFYFFITIFLLFSWFILFFNLIPCCFISFIFYTRRGPCVFWLRFILFFNF